MEDKEAVREELRLEFLSDVPPEVEAEERLAQDWWDTHAAYVMWEDDVVPINFGRNQPRVWSF